EEADVLIVPPDADAPMRPLVINLRDAAVEGGFERVLEVVPADPAARDPLRERWRQYKARGFELKAHDMEALHCPSPACGKQKLEQRPSPRPSPAGGRGGRPDE